MALEREDLGDLLKLNKRNLEEISELKRELERQTALLERLPEKIASLERSQE